jgi:acetyl-CoA decarbonylase/synthase complex subunit delta
MFKKSVQKFSGKICEVEVGTGEKAIKLGGENVLSFYGFDGEVGNTAKVGMEISDDLAEWPQLLKDFYKDVCNDPVAWAKHLEETYAPDFICLKLDSSDPNGQDKPVEECAKVAKAVVEAIKIPLVVSGTGTHDKDAKLLEKVAAELDGHNVLLLAAVEDNYKTIAAAGAMAYSHKIGAESSVDINLAKQMNILVNQLGVQNDKIIDNVGCAAAGYGYEYVISTLERIRLAALGQDDKTLQVPIITPVSFETWKVKESIDGDAWEDQEGRGISMEITTAAGVLASGSNAVILRHPKSVETIKKFINELV